MVICAAVGGRLSVLGAVYGTLVVNFGKTFFSEKFPELWLFLIGALFIAVVLVFPNGLAGFNRAGLRGSWEMARKRWAALRRHAGAIRSATAGSPPNLPLSGTPQAKQDT